MQNFEEGSKGELPYYLYLNLFEDASSLLVLGDNPTLEKSFKEALKKTSCKPYISVGVATLDSNDILQLIPSSQDAKVKPKAVVDSFKKSTIKPSASVFWSGRKINNTIIGTSTEENANNFINTDVDTSIGDENLVSKDEKVEVDGVQCVFYDQFESFRTKDYLQSREYRNTEYYTGVLQQLDQWSIGIRDEFQSKKDPKTRSGYQTMLNTILEFKKGVKEDMSKENSNSLNEFSDLNKFQKLYTASIDKYYKALGAYERSIELAKIRRILIEMHQMDEKSKKTEAFIQLDKVIKIRLKKADEYEETLSLVDSDLRKQINSLVHNIATTSEQLKVSLDSNEPDLMRT